MIFYEEMAGSSFHLQMFYPQSRVRGISNLNDVCVPKSSVSWFDSILNTGLWLGGVLGESRASWNPECLTFSQIEIILNFEINFCCFLS